jgi:hypothetical protein
MGTPVRVAPCPLLFERNGGTFDERGRPILHDVEDDGYAARAKCDRAFDCGLCPLVADYVNGMAREGFRVGWECSDCLSVSYQYERNNPEVERILPGFYQAGWKNDPETPLEGCTSCRKESSFLQLVLRRPR